MYAGIPNFTATGYVGWCNFDKLASVMDRPVSWKGAGVVYSHIGLFNHKANGQRCIYTTQIVETSVSALLQSASKKAIHNE